MRRFLVVVAAIVIAVLGVVLFVLTRAGAPGVTTPARRSDPIARVIADAGAVAEPPHGVAPADAATADAPGTERETALAQLRASGSGREGWDAQATALFDSIARRTVEVSDVGCFTAGCGALLTFSSDATYRRELDALQASDDYHAWTGGKKLTKPETRADGRISIALVLYRPD